jgi:hypothetical protein
MTEPDKSKKLSWIQPVAVAVLIALFAGGTAPWWLQELKSIVGRDSPKTNDRFTLLGKWTGSRDCTVRFFLDDGKNIKGVCDIGVVSHSLTGTYLDNRSITLRNVRRDQKGCETNVDGTIIFRDKNTIEYSQAGWDGCGVRTPPIDLVLIR